MEQAELFRAQLVPRRHAACSGREGSLGEGSELSDFFAQLRPCDWLGSAFHFALGGKVGCNTSLPLKRANS